MKTFSEELAKQREGWLCLCVCVCVWFLCVCQRSLINKFQNCFYHIWL